MSHSQKQQSSKASKIKDLEKSDEYKALSAKVTHTHHPHKYFRKKGNLTNMANVTELANIKQQMTSNFTALVQNLEDLKNNTQFAFPNK